MRRFLYGRAFRAPNGFEDLYDDRTSDKGNPDLTAGKIATWEDVGQRRLNGRWRPTVAGYRNRISGPIGEAVDPEDGLTLSGQPSARPPGPFPSLSGMSPEPSRSHLRAGAPDSKRFMIFLIFRHPQACRQLGAS